MSPKAIAILLVGVLAVAGVYLADRLWLASVRGQNPGTAGETAALMQPLPNFTLTTREGTEVNLSDFEGKVLVLNFWATWCLPCKVEIPFFNKTYAEYREQGVEFVAVSEDAGGWSDIEAFVQETPIAYPVLLDRDESAGQAVGGLPGLPVTVFVDRRGRMAYKHVGITDINTLRTNIERLLESSAGVSP